MHCGWDSGATDNLSICGSEVFLKCLIEFFSRRFRSKLVFWFSDNSLGLGGKVEKLRKPLQVALQEPWPHPEIKIYYVILMWFIFIIRNKFLCHQREKTIGQNLIFSVMDLCQLQTNSYLTFKNRLSKNKFNKGEKICNRFA